MKKTIFLFVLLNLFSSFIGIRILPAYENKSGRFGLAVLNFAAKDNMSINETTDVSNFLHLKLDDYQVFDCTNRDYLWDILQKNDIDLSSCSSFSAGINAGRVLGIPYIINGSIGKMNRVSVEGYDYSIHFRVIDVNQGDFVYTIEDQYVGSTDGFFVYLSDLVKIVHQKFIDLNKSSLPSQQNTKKITTENLKTNVIPEYLLGFGDVIEVKFFNQNRYNETLTIRPDGRISMERVGEIYVAGMTPLQLDNLITAQYGKFLQNPDVTVIVREFGGYQVYVLGEVNTPGGYPIQRNMTLLQAIASAGGQKNTAKLKSVMVLRRGDNGTINAIKVNLNSQLKGSRGKLNVDDSYVQPQDIVYVPRTFISNVNNFLTQIYEGVLPPVDVYLRALWWSGGR